MRDQLYNQNYQVLLSPGGAVEVGEQACDD